MILCVLASSYSQPIRSGTKILFLPKTIKRILSFTMKLPTTAHAI